MMYGICNLSVVPCRAQPFDKSEMVTQLLFGEHFKILAEEEKWALIKITYDGYECWIDKKQFVKILEEEYNLLNNEPQRLSFEIIKNVKSHTSHLTSHIFIGSTLPDFAKGKFKIANEEFYFRGKTTGIRHPVSGAQITATAKLYMNAPYLWGGRSPFGIDCSGLTQMVFKLNGIKLPRDASQQAEIGETLNFIEEVKKGDVAFFDNEEGKIIHTGIIIGSSSIYPKRKVENISSPAPGGRAGGVPIIHASGKVRIDTLDHYGIFNSVTGKYSHNLRLIKRVI